MDNLMYYRDVSLLPFTSDRSQSEAESVRLNFSFASEVPHRRMDWENWEVIDEILDCQQSAIRGDRLESGLIQFLWNHDPDKVRGVIEGIEWKDGKGNAIAKMSGSIESKELYRNIQDGIIKGISVGYKVHDSITITDAVWEDEPMRSKLLSPKKIRVTDWEILEISAVSIPADATVGIGRSVRSLDITKLMQKMEPDLATIGRLEADNAALKSTIAALEAQVANIKKTKDLSDQWAKLKEVADSLVRSACMPANECSAIFGCDIAEMSVDDATIEIRTIARFLEIAKQRAPLLNLRNSQIPIETESETELKSAIPRAIESYQNAWRSN